MVDYIVPPVSNKLYTVPQTTFVPQMTFMPQYFPSMPNFPFMWGSDSIWNYNMPYNFGNINFGSSSNSLEASSRNKTQQQNASPVEQEKFELSSSERKDADDAANNDAAEQKKREEVSFKSSLLMGTPFIAGSIVKGAQMKTNMPATEMFFALDDTGKAARYAELYEKAPTVMEEAQGAMAKACRKYQRDLKRAAGNADEIQRLNKEFESLKKMMTRSLETGLPENVARTTARLNGANAVKNTAIRKWWRYLKGENPMRSRVSAAKNVKTAKVKPVLGNKFLKNAGGKLGVGIGIAGSGYMLYKSKDKIKEAYSYDKKTGRKQLWQSISESSVPLIGYTAGDAIGRTATKFLVKKFATKLATKLVAKGACKALGAAIGSIIPGAGTIVGLLIGTALDFALSKLIPLIFGENDAVTEARNKHRNDSERIQALCIKNLNGEKMSPAEQKIIDSHPAFCAKEMQQVQQQLAQAQLAQSQLGVA